MEEKIYCKGIYDMLNDFKPENEDENIIVHTGRDGVVNLGHAINVETYNKERLKIYADDLFYGKIKIENELYLIKKHWLVRLLIKLKLIKI